MVRDDVSIEKGLKVAGKLLHTIHSATAGSEKVSGFNHGTETDEEMDTT